MTTLLLKAGNNHYPAANLSNVEERDSGKIVVRFRGEDPIVLNGDAARAFLAQVASTPSTAAADVRADARSEAKPAAAAPVIGLKEQAPAK